MITEKETTAGSIPRPQVRKVWKRACAVVLLCAATAGVSNAGCAWWCFNDMADFVGANGMNPIYMTLVQGADGNLYGTTEYGGSATAICAEGCGTVFKIAMGGTTVTT